MDSMVAGGGEEEKPLNNRKIHSILCKNCIVLLGIIGGNI